MYHRMFLGLAFHDIIRNLTFLVGTWAIPSNLEGYFMNLGNVATCKAEAFFAELSSGVLLYVAAICLTSCLAIRHDFKESKFVKVELKVHIICNLIPLVAACALVLSNHEGPDRKNIHM